MFPQSFISHTAFWFPLWDSKPRKSIKCGRYSSCKWGREFLRCAAELLSHSRQMKSQKS